MFVHLNVFFSRVPAMFDHLYWIEPIHDHVVKCFQGVSFGRAEGKTGPPFGRAEGEAGRGFRLSEMQSRSRHFVERKAKQVVLVVQVLENIMIRKAVAVIVLFLVKMLTV